MTPSVRLFKRNRVKQTMLDSLTVDAVSRSGKSHKIKLNS